MYDENMEKNNGKTKLGWCIPKNIREDFTEFCATKGTLIQEECAGALIIYQFLPAEIRELARLQAKGVEDINSDFWKDFASALRLGIKAQQDNLHKRRKKR